MRQCERCGREIDPSARFCPECGAPNTAHPPPAGFWIRVVASLVDSLVFLPIGILTFVNIFQIKSVGLMIALVIPGLLYKPLMESYFGATLGKMACKVKVIDNRGRRPSLSQAYTRYIPFLVHSVVSVVAAAVLFSDPDFQAALGLYALGKLEYNNPVDLLQNVILVFIFVDCLVAAFTYRKLALHDMMAQTFCVYK